jgi:hypothetical protein
VPEVNRSRHCRLCDQRVRIQLPAPKPDDPDYKVAVCPTCDIGIFRDKEKV